MFKFETDQILERRKLSFKCPQLYSRWMGVVLIVFVVCECLLFYWGHDSAGFTDAIFWAYIGLLYAGLFFLMRWCRVLKKTGCAIFLLVLVMFLTLHVVLLPAVSTVREVALRMGCSSHLTQLGIALQSYHDEFGQIPPVFVTDESGHPMHSWRTLLLPFLEKKELYEGYDFQQPWNSPKNQALATKSTPSVLQCPSVSAWPCENKNRTDYVAVSGDDTLWPTDGSPRKFREVIAGTSNTAILIGINKSNILWHEPRDVKLDDLLSGKLSWSRTEGHSYPTTVGRSFLYKPGGVGRNILFADGSVRFTRGDLTKDQLRRLFSITEPFDPEELDNATLPDPPAPIFFRHIVFCIWLATLFMQLIYAYFPAGANMNFPQRDPNTIASMQAILQIKK